MVAIGSNVKMSSESWLSISGPLSLQVNVCGNSPMYIPKSGCDHCLCGYTSWD